MASAAKPPLHPRTKVPVLSWTLVRSEGRPREVVAFEEEVVGFFLESANLLGVPKSLAAIYGICFASPEPLSFTEVHERLDLSSGSISQGLKVLREVGALKVVRTELDSRQYVTPDLELRKLVQHWITERLQRQLSAGQTRLQSIAKAVPGSRALASKELRDRIKALQGWHDKASAVLPFVRTALKLG
jgi:HTH-type transcriptional regulator, glycine betaine synthesis regulator